MRLWGRPIQNDKVKVLEIGMPTSVEEAKQIARYTAQLLDTRGWCLWICHALGRETIAVIRDDSAEGIPKDIATYSEAELEELFSRDKPLGLATIRLIHEAKKVFGAKVEINEIYGVSSRSMRF